MGHPSSGLPIPPGRWLAFWRKPQANNRRKKWLGSSLNVARVQRVYVYVKLSLAVLCLAGLVTFVAPGWGQNVPLEGILKGVESRYNSVSTLQMEFVQVYTAANRAKRTESGRLQLRKPGRMRWEYFKPDGKLFISDGKEYWFYSPMAKRAEKMKLKEAQDWQAPLGMLIGRLDFQRDFSKYILQPQPSGLQRITCEPRNPDKSPSDRLPLLRAMTFGCRSWW